MLTELGLEGDEQAEKKVHGDQTERCVIILVSIISTGRGISGTGGVVCCACVWRKSLNRGLTESNVYMGDIFRWGEALIRSASRARLAINSITILISANSAVDAKHR